MSPSSFHVALGAFPNPQSKRGVATFPQTSAEALLPQRQAPRSGQPGLSARQLAPGILGSMGLLPDSEQTLISARLGHLPPPKGQND